MIHGPSATSTRRVRAGLAALWMVCLGWAGVRVAQAEPYLAVATGNPCVACHVNPTGGGMRNAFGDAYAQTALPASGLPAGSPIWTGQLLQNILRVGADLRAAWSQTTTPHAPTERGFQLEQMRLYADFSVIPGRLGLYVDETVAPAVQNMEAYLRYGDPTRWYLKAGQFYLPFGWRLQDNSALVRQASGISMLTPDQGIELGFERVRWNGQLDFTNGAGNAGVGSGYQLLARLVRVQGWWRIGASAASTQSHAGNRRMGAVFAGLRTGPIAWLGEGDLIRQQGFADGAHTLLAGLIEADWLLRRGQNLKLTYEYYDPARRVSNDAQTRWSAVYEFTPMPFLQLRAGVRRSAGIPQNDLQNRTLAFLELHGYL